MYSNVFLRSSDGDSEVEGIDEEIVQYLENNVSDGQALSNNGASEAWNPVIFLGMALVAVAVGAVVSKVRMTQLILFT